MIRENRKLIIKAVTVVLAAALIGKYIIPAAGKLFPGGLWIILSGLAAVSLIRNAVQIVISALINRYMRRTIIRLFPQSTEDMRRIGVESPLDFTYLVCNTTSYVPVAPLGRGNLPGRLLHSRKLMKQSLDMFEEMFGREPLGAESEDWETITACEISDVLGRDVEDISLEEYEENVSENVREYVKVKHGERVRQDAA